MESMYSDDTNLKIDALTWRRGASALPRAAPFSCRRRCAYGFASHQGVGNPPAVLAHRAGVPFVEATGVAKRRVRNTLSEKILKKILN